MVTAASEKLEALEENGLWEVVIPPTGSHVLHYKWPFKSKTDTNNDVERYKARLVACGNEQLVGVAYTLTFAAVVELSTVKVILVLSRRWNVSARHVHVPNAYVKAENEPHLDVYMKTLEQAIVLEIVQGWVYSMHDGYVLYFKKDVLTIVGVYVDDLLVTGTFKDAVDQFFKDGEEISWSSNLLDEEVGYVLYQEVSIDLLLKEYGLEAANGVRAPIVEEFNDCNSQEPEYLPVNLDRALSETGCMFCGTHGDLTNAQAYYARLEDGEAYFKVLEGDQNVQVADRRRCFSSGDAKIESWGDADFVADKFDRKSVSGCVVMIDGAVVLWPCKKQTGVALSTMEPEFIALSQASRELLGLRQSF
uniref:GagPol polyprotein putative n=1 Tax=Albugo laibachii Nc14 TaxID=890382 RepID=F0WTV6_9STRA|nr:GagPol polyprotein putative [Albugo laibachii Nc14]|eukprot:CCA24800.1 GagPol polyprotein putative [Albugo laibachii Nc14]